MKRILATLLALILVLSVCPVMADEELTTIKVMAVNNSVTVDGQPTYFSDVLEGKYESDAYNKLVADLAERGLQIEWDLVTSDQYSTYLRTQIASGIEADLFSLKPLDEATRISMAKSGQFQSIYDLKQYSDGTLTAWLETGYGSYYARDEIDGKLYWLPRMTVSALYNGVPRGNLLYPYIRLDWLEMLEMEMPDTLDELTEYILACRKNDVNKTGVEDEMISVNGAAMSFWAELFGLYGDTWYYVDENDTFTTPWQKEEQMKAYITWLNELHVAGVLETTSAAETLKSENKLIGETNWASRQLSLTVDESLPTPLFTPITFNALEGYNAYLVEQCGIDFGSAVFAVNPKADLQAVTKLLDYVYTEEYIDLQNFGVEGIAHVTDPETGYYLTPDPIEGNYDNMKAQGGRMYANFNEDLPSTDINRSYDESHLSWHPVNKDYIENSGYGHDYPYTYLKTPESSVIALATEEEAEIVAMYKTDLETYMSELLNKLIFGEKSLDDWDTYMKEMEELGMSKILKVYQDRWDRTPDVLKQK